MSRYRNYSQSELDAQYDQRTLVADLQPYFDAWERGAREAAALEPRVGVAYGSHDDETLDVFQPQALPAPVHVHYHGGAWKALGSRDAWFLAKPWVDAGYVFVSVNFTLIPGCRLADQVEQTTRALHWCLTHADELGGQPERVSVSGHSSGAHLAAMAALTHEAEPALERAILASGVYDLEPVRLSNRNAYLDLSDDDVSSLSPIRNLCDLRTPVDVLWSVNELEEFQRQGAELVDALLTRGIRAVAHQLDVANHFETWPAIVPALTAQLSRD